MFRNCFSTLSPNKKCLKNIGTDKITSANELYATIFTSLDPNPKEKIHELVNAYIENRKKRICRSKSIERETFMKDFLKDYSDIPLPNHISLISSKIAFKNDWHLCTEIQTIAEENSDLSLSSSYIKKLTSLNPLPSEDPVSAIRIFNNPFWTAHMGAHISMKNTCEKVILVVIRDLTRQTMNSDFNKPKNKAILRVIRNLTAPEHKQLNREIFILKTQIKNLKKEVADLKR